MFPSKIINDQNTSSFTGSMVIFRAGENALLPCKSAYRNNNAMDRHTRQLCFDQGEPLWKIAASSDRKGTSGQGVLIAHTQEFAKKPLLF